MKVEINTKDRTIYVVANDIAQDLETVDKWIKALRVARGWLRKETNKPIRLPRPEGTTPLSEKQVASLRANFQRTHGEP